MRQHQRSKCCLPRAWLQILSNSVGETKYSSPYPIQNNILCPQDSYSMTQIRRCVGTMCVGTMWLELLHTVKCLCYNCKISLCSVLTCGHLQGELRHRNRKTIFKSILDTCIFFLILTWSHGPFFFISSLEATSSLRTMTCFIEGRSVSLNLWDLYASTLKTENWVKKCFPCISSFTYSHTYLHIRTSFINAFHLDTEIKALFDTF